MGREEPVRVVFLEKKLSAYMRAVKLRRDACYLQGDFLGDRTQYLEVEAALGIKQLFGTPFLCYDS